MKCNRKPGKKKKKKKKNLQKKIVGMGIIEREQNEAERSSTWGSKIQVVFDL